MAAPDTAGGRVRARGMAAPRFFNAFGRAILDSPLRGRTAASPTPSAWCSGHHAAMAHACAWRTFIAHSEVTSVGIDETSARRGHDYVNPPQVRLI